MDKKKTNLGKWNDGHFVPVNPEFIEFVNKPKPKDGSGLEAPAYGSLQSKGTRAKKNSNGTVTLVPPNKGKNED